jgi:hypothetical protein
VQAGNPTYVARAFEGRIAGEGACDADGDGIESFEETVILAFDAPAPEDRIYEPVDCDPSTDGVQYSVRLVSIIVFEEPPVGPSNLGHPIYAFAGMYIMGCTLSDGEVSIDDLDPFCDVPGGGSTFIQPPSNSVQFVEYSAHHACGHQSVPTCTPTPTPTPTNTPTPAPTNTPGGPAPTPTPGAGTCGGVGGCGHVVVWSRFVNLIFTDAETGAPTEATTIFSISLAE